MTWIQSQQYRNSLWRIRRTKSLLISESAAIRIGYNLARVYYFTHTTRGPCDSPDRSRRARGYSRQPFPTWLNRWGYAQLARGDLVPPRTSLNFPTHSSTRGPAKPPCIARWPRIWDRAPMIKSKKVFSSSVPLYWICGSTEKVLKADGINSVLNWSKRTMPMWLHSRGPTIPLESRYYQTHTTKPNQCDQG